MFHLYHIFSNNIMKQNDDHAATYDSHDIIMSFIAKGE